MKTGIVYRRRAASFKVIVAMVVCALGICLPGAWAWQSDKGDGTFSWEIVSHCAGNLDGRDAYNLRAVPGNDVAGAINWC